MDSVMTQHRAKKRYAILKRACDLVFSTTVILAGCLPAAFVCLAITLDSKGGNPIFTQERLGKNGKPIRIYKLRTMVKDSDNVEKYFTPEQLAIWKREYKVDNDPRITRTGNFLRRTSLDELPQFLNVLKGDLSLIGPRPIVTAELSHYGDKAEEFLSCKPGITGWWQVTARNNATYANGQRQELELYYVRHACTRLDAAIFVKTFSAIINQTGK